MNEIELDFVSIGGRIRSGCLVDMDHLGFLSGHDHCSIREGAGSQRSDPCRGLPRVHVYECGVICVLKLRHTDGVRTRADSHARVNVINEPEDTI